MFVKTRMLRAACIGLLPLALVAGNADAQAATRSYRTDYKVTLAGLSIAQATFIAQFESRGYTISGNFKSAGIADVLASMSADTKVSGELRNDRLESTRYSLIYRKGKKTSTYDVRMQGGDVTQSKVTPEPKKRKNWVPVTEKDLKSVLDPLTSLMIPEGKDVCARTLPIYDGESRMDLVLSAKGKKSFSAGDLETEAIVCSVRYVPKSGYRKGRDDIEYLAKASGMEIWFAKTSELQLYAPVHARIPTRYGTVNVTAVKFGG